MNKKEEFRLVNICDKETRGGIDKFICHPITFEAKERYFDICNVFAIATGTIDYKKIYEILCEYKNFHDSEYIVDLFEEKLSWLHKEDNISSEIHNNISSLNTGHFKNFSKKHKNITLLYYLPSSMMMLHIFYNNKLNNLPNKLANITLYSAGQIHFNIKCRLPIKCSITIKNEMIHDGTLKNIFKLKKNVLIEASAKKRKTHNTSSDDFNKFANKKSQTTQQKYNLISFSFKKTINNNKNIYTINKYLERKDEQGDTTSYCKNKNDTEYFDNTDKFIYKITGGFFSVYSPNFVPCTKKYEVENVFSSEKVSIIIY